MIKVTSYNPLEMQSVDKPFSHRWFVATSEQDVVDAIQLCLWYDDELAVPLDENDEPVSMMKVYYQHLDRETGETQTRSIEVPNMTRTLSETIGTTYGYDSRYVGDGDSVYYALYVVEGENGRLVTKQRPYGASGYPKSAVVTLDVTDEVAARMRREAYPHYFAQELAKQYGSWFEGKERFEQKYEKGDIIVANTSYSPRKAGRRGFNVGDKATIVGRYIDRYTGNDCAVVVFEGDSMDVDDDGKHVNAQFVPLYKFDTTREYRIPFVPDWGNAHERAWSKVSSMYPKNEGHTGMVTFIPETRGDRLRIEKMYEEYGMEDYWNLVEPQMIRERTQDNLI